MQPDIRRIDQFYGSALGENLAFALHRRIDSLWPAFDQKRFLVLGAAPFLTQIKNPDTPDLLLPSVEAIPEFLLTKDSLKIRNRKNRLILDSTRLPFDDQAFSQIIIAHYLENCDHVSLAFREIWRILADDGRAIFVLPYRFGLWSLWPSTPFTQSHSYGKTQMASLLRRHFFEMTAYSRAAYMPPVNFFARHDPAHSWEAIGEKCWPFFGGVIMIEVMKCAADPLLRNKQRYSEKQQIRLPQQTLSNAKIKSE